MYRHFGNNTYECCIVNTDSPDRKYHWNYIISCNGGRLVYTGQKISLVIKEKVKIKGNRNAMTEYVHFPLYNK